jgi:hypothetical protein
MPTQCRYDVTDSNPRVCEPLNHAAPRTGHLWTRLRNSEVEQRDPVLERLQSEAAENQADTDAPQTPLRKLVGVVLNQWNDGALKEN